MPIPTIGAAAPAAITVPPATSPAPGRSFGAILESCASRRDPASAGVEGGGRVSAAALRGLESIERAQARLDGVLAAARSGRTFTAQELMALQGEAYRFSQAVELSARLVEQGAQAVKQALHAQV